MSGWRIALLPLLLLAGCPRQERPGPPAQVNHPDLFRPRPADPADLSWEETLHLPLERPLDSLNPLFTGSTESAVVAGLLHDSLVGVGTAMEFTVNETLVERLVEEPGGKAFELTLRPGLRWQDGAPLTAADLSFSFGLLLDQRVPVRRMRTMGGVVEHEQVLGDRVWRISFRAPSPLNRWELLFPLLPAHLWKPVAAEDPTLYDSPLARALSARPVGNGPYKLLRYTPEEELLLERWDDYPGPRAAFRRIHWRVLPDRQAALLAFRAGRLDWVRVASPADFFALATDPARRGTGRLARGDTWTYQFVAWNIAGRDLFTDPRVRRALGMALDRAWAMKALFQAPLTLASGPFHPSSWAADPELAPLPFDPAEADRLLSQAGWLKDAKGWRTKQGRSFSFELMLPAGSAATRGVCLRWRDELERLGIELNLAGVEGATFQERFRAGAFDAAMMAWGAGVDPATSAELFATGGSKNFGGYASAAADALFEAGRTAVAPEQRAAAYRALHRHLALEQPYTFLWFLPELVLLRPDLSGLAFGPRGVLDFTPGLQGWWLPAGGD